MGEFFWKKEQKNNIKE